MFFITWMTIISVTESVDFNALRCQNKYNEPSMNLTKICIEFQRTNESKRFSTKCILWAFVKDRYEEKANERKNWKVKRHWIFNKFELKTSNISGLKTFQVKFKDNVGISLLLVEENFLETVAWRYYLIKTIKIAVI